MEAKGLPSKNKLEDLKKGNAPKIKPFIIGITGGTASGKTTLCNTIVSHLGGRNVVLISMDSFYKPLTEEQIKNVGEHNFDHPNALDFDLIKKTLDDLILGKDVHVPVYDFKTHSRKKETERITWCPIIIFEGILSLYAESLRSLMALKIFVNIDDDIRLARRILRDINERGRKLDSVLIQYNKHVKGAYDMFIKPTMQYADLIVPGNENQAVVNMVVNDIEARLRTTGHLKPRSKQITPKMLSLLKYEPKKLVNDEALAQAKYVSLHYYKGGEAELMKCIEFALVGDSDLRKIGLTFLAQKLSLLMVREGAFVLRKQREYLGLPFTKRSEIEVFLRASLKLNSKVFLFYPAICTPKTIEEINYVLEMMSADDNFQVMDFCLLTYFLCPTMLADLHRHPQMKVFFLALNPSISASADYLMNDTCEYSTPTRNEYAECLREVLSNQNKGARTLLMNDDY